MIKDSEGIICMIGGMRIDWVRKWGGERKSRQLGRCC